MEWVTWILFEELAALGALLFTVNFILLVYWRRSGRWQPLVVGLAVAIVLLVVQKLVVTQREHAIRVLEPLENDVLTEQTTALAVALAPQFEASGMGRDDFLAYVQRQYDNWSISSLRRSSVLVSDSTPDRFVVVANYQANIMSQGFAGLLPTSWDITFVKTETGWQILAVQPRHIAGVSNPSWRQLDAP